jgi:hypothetical protein
MKKVEPLILKNQIYNEKFVKKFFHTLNPNNDD